MPVWRALDETAGDGGAPDDSERSYVPLQWADTREQMLALAHDRISQASTQVHLIGFSMGGYIAALAALKNPAKVAFVTLIGYDARGLSHDETSRRKQLLDALTRGKYRGMADARLAQLISDPQQHQPAAQTVLDMDADLGGSVLAAHTRATTPREDLVEQLRRAPFPVHLLAADKDTLVPLEEIRRTATDINAASFEILGTCGHMMPLEQPERVAISITQHS